MKKLNANDFYTGLKIIINKIPFYIIENEFIKPGKGQSFNRVKLRNLISHKIIEKTTNTNNQKSSKRSNNEPPKNEINRVKMSN